MMSTPMNGAASRLKDGREGVLKRRIFDAVFLLGFLCCLVPGSMPNLTVYVSALLVLCIVVCAVYVHALHYADRRHPGV